MTDDFYPPPVKPLLSLGEPRRNAKMDYAALGLSLMDVPALIRMATDQQLHDGPQNSPAVWAPVHAWRALAQLRAEEAIAPLVELFSLADDRLDDWVSNDLPQALAQFGTRVLGPLAAYLAEARHGDWSRIAAAEAIGFVGKTQPEARADCIARLSAQLEHFTSQSETLNAFLISPLWDLGAVEAMPVIERAFASRRVDESVQGDVEDVRIQFGLKTKREHPPKPNSLTIEGERFRAQWQAAGLPLPEAVGSFSELDTEPSPRSQPHIAPPKVGRNEPCPCGSGKKHKKCCGG